MDEHWPLRCTVCAAPMEIRRGVTAGRPVGLVCSSGHHFDAAKQGYVNLLVGKGSQSTPDTAAMIMARERVQEADVFTSLTEMIAELADPALPASGGIVLDCGCGTGHHLHHLLDHHRHSRGLAVDLSPAGLRRAARHPRTVALAWDLWRPLPVASGSVDLLLDIFAPRNPAEYARVLRAGGSAVIVTPRSGHLAELAGVGLLGMRSDKFRDLQHRMAGHLGEPKRVLTCTDTVEIETRTAADLVMMGPAGHHRRDAEVMGHVNAARISTVTLDLDVTLWQLDERLVT